MYLKRRGTADAGWAPNDGGARGCGGRRRGKVAGVLPHDQVVVDDVDLPPGQRRAVGVGPPDPGRSDDQRP